MKNICRLFHKWSGWANVGDGKQEFRLCDKCGTSQTRTRK